MLIAQFLANLQNCFGEDTKKSGEKNRGSVNSSHRGVRVQHAQFFKIYIFEEQLRKGR